VFIYWFLIKTLKNLWLWKAYSDVELATYPKFGGNASLPTISAANKWAEKHPDKWYETSLTCMVPKRL
jgi:hypothetical protein